MVVTNKENGMVEVRSNTGEVVELDQGSYELAKDLIQLYKRTSPKTLKAAAGHLATDPEQNMGSRLLVDSIEMYLERRRSIPA